MKPQNISISNNLSCYIIAGPNGSGKTTFAMSYLPKLKKCKNFINADLIASGISPLEPEKAAIEDGYQVPVFLR